MKFSLVDLFRRFLPLLFSVIFIVFICFHMNIDGVNIVVEKEYQYVTYIYVASFIACVIGEIICKKKILSVKRTILFLLFILLGVSISPILKDWNLFFTFVVLFSCLDVIAILLKMLADSKIYQHRLQNYTLPVNQFTNKRKLVSRIVLVSSFTVFFVICFVVFYFNEVSLTALLELLFVGIVIAAISQIISSSVSLSPLNKHIKKYNKDLDFKTLEKKLLEYKSDNIHNETKNLINIELWKCAIFYDNNEAKKYESLVFMPKCEDNISKYYDAFFWNLLLNEKYDLILASEKLFRKYGKKKKEVNLFISLIKDENFKYKIKVKDRVSAIKANLANNWSEIMKFSEYKYQRPDYELFKTKVNELILELNDSNDEQKTEEILSKFLELSRHIDSMFSIASIRYNVNTNDEFYKNEYDFINEYSPLFADVSNDFYKVIVSKKTPYLEKKFGSLFFKMLENKERIFSKDIIEDLQTENNLVNQYDKIIADAKIEFRGNTYTLPQMKVFTSSVDRLTRKEASIEIDNFLASKSDEIDEIYDQLVKVRTKIANKLGFENYVELGYLNLNRFDYTAKEVKSYRENILKYVVPLANKLRAKQAKRINISDPEFYDYNLNFLDGNPTPKGNREELVNKALKMYSELSLETKEFFEFMTSHELLDLDSKHGKVGGGYCTFIPEYDSPFIFANFNTTAGDVEVLTHEAGHAFEVYTANKFLNNKEMLWPTLEACEIHSMSMEFLTYPWMESFFEEDLEKFKEYHISSAVTFIPYGALVDHFQHFVYENPNATKEERKQEWRRLEKEYLPYRKYSDQKTFESGAYWYMQGHIFSSPFYYIDYTLAQVCALQFLILSLEDHDKAFAKYYDLCKLGGSKSFTELLKSVNLDNPFNEDTLEKVMSKIENIINEF